MPASTEIYKRLWDNDENKFSVSRKTQSGEYENPEADILLDEQIKAGGKRNVDLAQYPLFDSVNRSKLNSEINKSYISLLNNYVVNYRYEEEVTDHEIQEGMDFLSKIKDTFVIKECIKYLKNDLNINIETKFETTLFEIWFRTYTNWYRGRSTHYASGFEHVFVGEGKYNPKHGPITSLGNISGYHNWIKFYLDESTGRVNFLGYNYGLNNNEGPDNPNVVTLQMLWNHRDINGDIVAELFKPRGGFFVGSSPECEFALGTVAFYQSKKGLFSSNDQKSIKMAGGNYSLVMYRNIEQSGSRGNHVRSFFPMYDGGFDSNLVNGDQPVIDPNVSQSIINDGDISIISAMINPMGVDHNQENVTIKNNSSQSILLNEWALRDRMGRKFYLSGDIDASDEKEILLTYVGEHSIQLGNKGGRIELVNPDNTIIASVKYERVFEGQELTFE